MLTSAFQSQLQSTLTEIIDHGLYKKERLITSAQDAEITLADGSRVINMCANNYLGLANHPAIREAATKAIEHYGYGLSSVRFICGTQDLHTQLEAALTTFLGTEDTILYPSCFDANGGLFETLLTADDAVISDSLNHASIIDGVRLCKAKRYRYANNDLADLEANLKQARADGARHILITSDGVFSMDGTIADLAGIHALAQKYEALVHFDDCHATGFLGEKGRGTHEHCGLFGKIDLTTGTLGKALGGASGGYTSGKKEIIELLRQRSRPYLFSNSIAPPIAAASLRVLELLTESTDLADLVKTNALYFRESIASSGLTVSGTEHPITPVILGDAKLSQDFSAKLLQKNIYAIGFFFPVVPQGTARIRTQISAAHTRDHLDQALEAFTQTAQDLAII
ncbi:MAG: glycine C-acetyltransferase [Verrucomicrobiaceae bacterium]